MNIKEEVLYFLSFSHVNYKPTKIDFICNHVIPAGLNQGRYITNHTSNIELIEIEGKDYYFRPCRIRNRKKELLESLICDYFCNIAPGDNNTNERARGFIKEKLQKKSQFSLFFHMGTKMDIHSPLAQFLSTHDYHLIGLETPPSGCEEVIDHFIQYFWGELYGYKLNKGTPFRYYQLFNAERQISTRLIAETLNLEHLIPETTMVCLQQGDNSKYGTLMRAANGLKSSAFEAKTRASKISPKLQRELNNLNILDVIKYEKDHRPNNYNVVLDESGLFDSVVAFDNDSPVTFFPSSRVDFVTYVGCSPLVKDGYINRPYLDKRTVDSLLKIDGNYISELLNPYLSLAQIRAINKRIDKLRKSISISINEKRLKLLEPYEWNENTLREEMSGKYGDTYIMKFLSSDWEKKK